MNKAELEQLLENAIAIRKKAYRVRAPRLFIMSINADIRRFQAQLADLEIA